MQSLTTARTRRAAVHCPLIDIVDTYQQARRYRNEAMSALTSASCRVRYVSAGAALSHQAHERLNISVIACGRGHGQCLRLRSSALRRQLFMASVQRSIVPDTSQQALLRCRSNSRDSSRHAQRYHSEAMSASASASSCVTVLAGGAACACAATHCAGNYPCAAYSPVSCRIRLSRRC